MHEDRKSAASEEVAMLSAGGQWRERGKKERQIDARVKANDDDGPNTVLGIGRDEVVVLGSIPGPTPVSQTLSTSSPLSRNQTSASSMGSS